jgi:hypothetical protein
MIETQGKAFPVGRMPLIEEPADRSWESMQLQKSSVDNRKQLRGKIEQIEQKEKGLGEGPGKR